MTSQVVYLLLYIKVPFLYSLLKSLSFISEVVHHETDAEAANAEWCSLVHKAWEGDTYHELVTKRKMKQSAGTLHFPPSGAGWTTGAA